MARKTKQAKGPFLTAEGDIKDPSSTSIPMLCGLFAILVIMGLVNLYSAAAGDDYFYAQLKRIVLGMGFFVGCGWFLQVRHLNTYAYWIYGGTCAALLVVLLLGYTAGGSQRWIYIGGIGIQPSEFAKLTVAIVVARYFFTNRLNSAYQLRDLWPLMLLVGCVFALIFKQPDLGTAGICLIIAACQVAFMRLDLRSIGIVFASSVIVAGIGWNFLLRDYQKLRILNLLNPNLDPSGSGYNSIQSLVAIGSGGTFGKGFLAGTQTQLQFLPARHTDFVFSVFAEEWGFWGAALVFLLFGLLAYITLEVARHASDVFSALLAIGVGALFFIEFLINVAMVLGVFPVVGMPLPFFSYGGSSLLAMCMGIGLLVAVERQTLSARRVGRDDSSMMWTGFLFKDKRKKAKG